MSADAKVKDERKRAAEVEDGAPDAKRAALAPGAGGVALPGSAALLDTMRSVVECVDSDFKSTLDSPYYDVLIMFNRGVRDGKDGKSCIINFTILDVEGACGVRAGFSTAPYEADAVEKQREYFGTDRKLKPGVRRTVLNKVTTGVHGYCAILTPHTYKEHPKQAQKMKGKGLGSEKPMGALYPGVELGSFIFMDGPKGDMFESEASKKDIAAFSLARVRMAAQREDKAEGGYGLRIKNISVCNSAPTAALFDNTQAYYSDHEEIEAQTKRFLGRENFDNEEGRADNACFQSMTKEHSQYANPLVVLRGGPGALSQLVMGADGASMELTVLDKKSIYSQRAMQVQVHHAAFATGGPCMDLRWVHDYYNVALQAGAARVVVLHDERALKADGGHRLQCLVLVREAAFFEAPQGAACVDFTVPARLVAELASAEVAAAQKRDALVLVPAAKGERSKYCAWRVGAASNLYAVLSHDAVKRKSDGGDAAVTPAGASAVCALREIRRLPGTTFNVLFLCRVGPAGELLEVVQCAVLQPSVMPQLPKSVATAPASSSVGLFAEIGI